MNRSSTASGLSSRETVRAIIAAKPLDMIIGQPTTQTMNLTMDQITKMVATVRRIAWGDKHSCLVLILDDANYIVAIRSVASYGLTPL